MRMNAPAQPSPTPVNSSSSHEVWKWIHQEVAKSYLKPCAHLGVDPMEETDQGQTIRHFFIPVCARDSFEWIDFRGNSPNNDLQVIYLAHQLEREPIRCPADCMHYRNARQQWIWETVKKAGATVRYLGVPFQWFAKLPAAQVCVLFALVVLAIVLAIPRTLPSIIQLLKAYHGQ